jgi:hypothetical protein
MTRSRRPGRVYRRNSSIELRRVRLADRQSLQGGGKTCRLLLIRRRCRDDWLFLQLGLRRQVMPGDRQKGLVAGDRLAGLRRVFRLRIAIGACERGHERQREGHERDACRVHRRRVGRRMRQRFVFGHGVFAAG